jgi:hypothetical protein
MHWQSLLGDSYITAGEGRDTVACYALADVK